jgi:ketopantoate reductase
LLLAAWATAVWTEIVPYKFSALLVNLPFEASSLVYEARYKSFYWVKRAKALVFSEVYEVHASSTLALKVDNN